MDDETFSFSLSNSNSRESKIKYKITHILICKIYLILKSKLNLNLVQSSEYYNKLVYISSYHELHYVSALISDASTYQTSITMSRVTYSVFNITTGLDQYYYHRNSSILISFLTTLVPNAYLRHEGGRIKLRKNDRTWLFQLDASFKLLRSNKIRNMFAFESVNVPNSYLAVDTDTKTSLLLTEPILKINRTIKTIDELDQRFLFKFISFQ
jgi:hypothetical protein